MSKIQELIKSDDTIMVFDVDGVLARIEYGEYNHFCVSDEVWSKIIDEGALFYPDSQAIPSMVDYIKTKNIDNIYTCSKSYSKKEDEMKIRFLKSVYNIREDHIFFVRNNDEKLSILNQIKENHKELSDTQIAMVDDNIEVLNNIKDNSNFATIHISSFMQ